MLDGGSIGSGGHIDCNTFLLRELKEELGVDQSKLQLIGLFEDAEAHTFDIAIRFDIALNAMELMSAFKSIDNNEYDRIAIVSTNKLSTFVDKHTPNFVGLTLGLLNQYFEL